MQVTKLAHEPPTDVERVVEEEIREWHFHIYFLQRNAAQHAAALALRDAILRLRRDGAFVAVPLYRVNTAPIGPHPVAKVSFASSLWSRPVFTEYMQGPRVSPSLDGTLISTRFGHFANQERKNTVAVPVAQYVILIAGCTENRALKLAIELGYSSIITGPTIEERKAAGRKIEQALRREGEAAPAPTED
ncbi:hypothetical protein FRC11_011256 [Ceratobasidium sp. 423]|nr:hypothetical protein FRC11_011256 [Ceratobasidium sp. 423]